MNKKLGIMGGTFDPIHVGHLMIAESVREALSLDEVLFIPSNNPPHKNKTDISENALRLEMVRLATADNPYFTAADIEIKREGKTYSLDTLTLLAEQYGSETELVFIIGADTVWELENWYKFKEVFKLCTFAAVSRPGYGKARLKKRIEYLKAEYNAQINLVNAPVIEISSTDIRKKVAAGESIMYLVPDSVGNYIAENKLYKRCLIDN